MIKWQSLKTAPAWFNPWLILQVKTPMNQSSYSTLGEGEFLPPPISFFLITFFAKIGSISKFLSGPKLAKMAKK